MALKRREGIYYISSIFITVLEAGLTASTVLCVFLQSLSSKPSLHSDYFQKVTKWYAFLCFWYQ